MLPGYRQCGWAGNEAKLGNSKHWWHHSYSWIREAGLWSRDPCKLFQVAWWNWGAGKWYNWHSNLLHLVDDFSPIVFYSSVAEHHNNQKVKTSNLTCFFESPVSLNKEEIIFINHSSLHCLSSITTRNNDSPNKPPCLQCSLFAEFLSEELSELDSHFR